MSSPAFPLGDVPFYWRMLDNFGTDRRGIPDMLPFAFSFRADLQLITQLENRVVLDWLERVYREDANVGYLQEGHALSMPYGDEFLRFVNEVLESKQLAPRSAMEIGCGGIYLLKRLKDRGMTVCGIDPSPVSVMRALQEGIEVIPEFYPSSTLSRKADLLFHHNVLEHVLDPVQFLRAHHANLSPEGIVVVAVPDCSEAIELGDISMMLHEHLVYFDVDSLASTFNAAGYEVISIGKSRFGGVLFGAARPAQKSIATGSNSGNQDKFTRFSARAVTAIEAFRRWLETSMRADNGAGFYVPIRALPYLSTCGKYCSYRFFDDDPGIHQRYFSGINVPVEDFGDLVSRPVSNLLVTSLSFGPRIAKKISDQFGRRIQTTVLRDLLVSSLRHQET